MLAMRFHWTPEQVGRMDPIYIEELLARLEADSFMREQEQKRLKAEARKRPSARRYGR